MKGRSTSVEGVPQSIRYKSVTCTMIITSPISPYIRIMVSNY